MEDINAFMKKYIQKVKVLFQTGLFHIFGSSVINKVISFLSNVVLVKILTKGEYGVFTYAWNIYSIVLLANGLGMESSVLQICSEQKDNEEYTNKVCNYASRFGVKFDIVLTGILIGIALFAPLKISGAKELLFFLCLLPMLQLLFNLTTCYLRAQKRNQDYARLSMINTALVFCVSAGGALLFREKGMVLGYYAAYSISIIIGFFFMHVKLFEKGEKLTSEEKGAVRSIAFVSMCNNGLSQLMYLLDVFVLGVVAPQEEILASYKVATIIPSALTFIPSSLVVYVYPYFAEHREDGRWCLDKYKKIVASLGSVNVVISAGLAFLAPLIIEIFFGKQYLDALPIFRILAVNYSISGTFRILSGNLLITQRKLKFNLLVAIVSGSVNVIADFLFIQWWGAIGAAIATVTVVVVSSVMSTTYLIYTFKKDASMKEQS